MYAYWKDETAPDCCDFSARPNYWSAGNITTKMSATIYLDHSNPVIHGVENTVTDWTNVAPVISV